MAISVDVQRIEMAEVDYLGEFSIVYVRSSDGGVVRLHLKGMWHEERDKAVADAINGK